ncbi:MAG: zinc-binding dehydrogenase [Kiritimatiellia bacterium]|jgi:threonine dehydrogenase-like Zn-dependent dehydrogenase|nr:zinc-binding dehydrogenase [Kiritimatiellia bacterium]
MRTVTAIEPNKVEIVELGEPEVGPYQAKVKTEVAYLCNATDGKLVAGHFPGVEDYPLVLGHESAGIVQAVGDKVRNFKVGDRVIGGLLFEFSDDSYATGWGGFCDYTLANDHLAMVEDGVADEEHGWFECYEIQTKVDSDIPVEAAALLCTWREVYGGVDDFQITPDDDVLIFGAGPVGLSFVKFLKLMGSKYVASVDPLEHKRERALAMGADAVFAPDSPELEKLTETRGKPLDVVVDAVGSPAIINAALPMIKLGGTIGVYGVIADESITINKGKGPYNFNLFVHQWPTRHRERAAQGPLCDWIREGKLNVDDFKTHEFPLEQINDALDAVKNGEVIKALLRY